MGRRRRRRLAVVVLLILGGWIVARLLRAPAPAPAAPPAPDPPGADPPGAAAPGSPVAPRRRAAPAPPRARRARPVPPRAARSGVRPAVIAAAALVMLAGGVAVAVGVRDDGPSGHAEKPLWSLALGEPAAVAPPAAWAPVRQATTARSRPGAGASVVATVATRTPEGAPNLVALDDPVAARTARRWVRVRLAGGSGAQTGWVRRGALGRMTTVQSHLVIDLAARRLTLVRLGRVVLQAPAGVGTAGAPSPVGEFYVRSRLTRYAGAFYGPVAFGLSAGAPALTDWPVAGSIGIHGTNRPQLVPGSVSRGSIRLRNPDVRRLWRLLPLGTPVTIR